jgi:hypothetical protein
MSTLRRLLVIPVALVALAACGSSGDSSPDANGAAATEAATTVPASVPEMSSDDQPVAGGSHEIIVQVGVDDAPTLGSRVEQVPVGSDVVLRLLSDGDEDYHLHGYDLEKQVAAGVEAVIRFTADEPGRFEVESHTTEQVLLVIDVV